MTSFAFTDPKTQRALAFQKYTKHIDLHNHERVQDRYLAIANIFTHVDPEDPASAFAQAVRENISPVCIRGKDDQILTVTDRPALDVIHSVIKDTDTPFMLHRFTVVDDVYLQCMLCLNLEFLKHEVQHERKLIEQMPDDFMRRTREYRVSQREEYIKYLQPYAYSLSYVQDRITEVISSGDLKTFEGWIEHARRDQVESLQPLVQALDAQRAVTIANDSTEVKPF